MATTPPVAQSIAEPGAPRYGPRFDASPYGLRKSARLSVQRRARTPSPPAAHNVTDATNSSITNESSLHCTKAEDINTSSDSSPREMPLKRLKTDGRNSSDAKDKLLQAPGATSVSMLPTPVKTPSKKDVRIGGKPTPRILFPRSTDPIEELTPTRKKNRSYRGRMSSVDVDDGEQAIEIYTDSKERVPEVDESPDNPFYVKSGRGTSHAARKENKKPDQDKSVQEVLARGEGMYYTFRGKKFLKRFDDNNDQTSLDGDEAHSGMLGIGEAEGPRRATRSSIKPRFLFPEATTRKQEPPMDLVTTDEEALTDVEPIQAEFAAHEDSNEPLSRTTPTEETFVPATPMKKHAGPATPPTTVRTTRSTAKFTSSDGISSSSLFKNDHPFGMVGESSAEKIAKGKKRGAPEGFAMEEAKKRMK